MQKTILIARNLKTGKDEILAGSEVSFTDQRAAYLEFESSTNEEFSEVGLYYLQPVKSPRRFITAAEADRRAKQHARQVEIEPSAEKPSAAKASLDQAEAAMRTANDKFQAAKKAYGICQKADEKLVLEKQYKDAKAAARLAITTFETARQAYHLSLHAAAVEQEKPVAVAPPKEPTPAEKRKAELNALKHGDLLALVEKLKADGKPVETGGKTNKASLIPAILKAEGLEPAE